MSINYQGGRAVVKKNKTRFQLLTDLMQLQIVQKKCIFCALYAEHHEPQFSPAKHGFLDKTTPSLSTARQSLMKIKLTTQMRRRQGIFVLGILEHFLVTFRPAGTDRTYYFFPIRGI